MPTFVVTRVRKETSADGTHKHIEGVCTNTGSQYTRLEVVSSIDARNVAKTSADGYEALIEKMRYWPRANLPGGNRECPVSFAKAMGGRECPPRRRSIRSRRQSANLRATWG